jgi:heterodisulfide reductase subunit C
MVSTTYLDGFIPEGKDGKECLHCGICLQKCPVMSMGKAESREEFKRLLNGEEPSRVLNECTFCFSCNSCCPQGLKPYALILQRMVERNQKNGRELPDASRCMMIGEGEKNFFHELYDAGSREDKAILEKWSALPAPSKDTLFIGCFGRTVPKSIEMISDNYNSRLTTIKIPGK